MGSSYLGTSWRHASDLRRVQPPDAENRMSGGVEGSRGAIPVTPSDRTSKSCSCSNKPRRSPSGITSSWPSASSRDCVCSRGGRHRLPVRVGVACRDLRCAANQLASPCRWWWGGGSDQFKQSGADSARCRLEQDAKARFEDFRRACDEAHSSNSRRHSSARTHSCFPKTPIVG